jgi:glycerol-3-phosphate dehydrogenase
VVVPAVTRGRALLLTARRDGRVFFVLPWGDHSLLGTTDVDDDRSPERVRPAAEDIRYLLQEGTRAIPALRSIRPVRAFAGVRSLVRSGVPLPWANAREHRIVREPGRITLIGGKYTTHRSLAERVVDQVVLALGVAARPCDTARRPVASGAGIESLRAAHPGRRDLPGGLAIGEAEVVHAVREERALRLEDVLLRRTRLWLDGRALRAAAEPAARWMAPHLDWSEPRVREEVERITAMLGEEERAIEEAMR